MADRAHQAAVGRIHLKEAEKIRQETAERARKAEEMEIRAQLSRPQQRQFDPPIQTDRPQQQHFLPPTQIGRPQQREASQSIQSFDQYLLDIDLFNEYISEFEHPIEPIGRYQYEPDDNRQMEQETAIITPLTNNAELLQKIPFHKSMSFYARFQSKPMIGIVKLKLTYKLKYSIARSKTIFLTTKLMNDLKDLMRNCNEEASTTFHSLARERNWKKRKRKTKTLHFLYQMHTNDDQTWLPNI